MRLPLFLGLLLANCLPVAAQSDPSAAPPAAVLAPPADTVAAIHRLFAARRKTCTYVVGGTALAAGAGAMTALNQPTPHTGSGFGGPIDGRPMVATFIGTVGAGVVGLELLTLGGWGQRAEARVVAACQQHQLPRRIIHRLKPIYFRP